MDSNTSNNISQQHTSSDVWSIFFQVLPGILWNLQQRDPLLSKLFQTVRIDWKQIIKSPYVALIGAIVGQKIRYQRARSIRGKLYQKFTVNFTILDIERVSDSALQECGVNRQGITTILEANSFMLRHHLRMTSAEDLRKLEKVSGIGPWTINAAILTSMKDWTIFPENDYFIKKRIQRLYQMDKIPTKKELQIRFQSWDPWQGIVCWFLWRWFPNKKTG